eukprot:1260950-Amphidinium_carterae.1
MFKRKKGIEQVGPHTNLAKQDPKKWPATVAKALLSFHHGSSGCGCDSVTHGKKGMDREKSDEKVGAPLYTLFFDIRGPSNGITNEWI